MKIPWSLKALIAILVLSGITAFALTLGCPSSQVPKAISDFTLLLTLIALLLYVYYTYVLARDVSTPSASITLIPFQPDPLQIMAIIHNSSKASLRCWCKLNSRVCGRPVSLEGFYGGKSSFDMQAI